jgi:hypothetical protein
MHTMATLTHTFFNIREGFEQLFPNLLKFKVVRSINPSSSEDASAGQEFIQELMDMNPDAFSSEVDVQYLMNCFPRRF